MVIHQQNLSQIENIVFPHTCRFGSLRHALLITTFSFNTYYENPDFGTLLGEKNFTAGDCKIFKHILVCDTTINKDTLTNKHIVCCLPASPWLSRYTALPSAYFLNSLQPDRSHVVHKWKRRSANRLSMNSVLKRKSVALSCSGIGTSETYCYFSHLPTQQTKEEAVLFSCASHQ